jgi:hypothetical protein
MAMSASGMASAIISAIDGVETSQILLKMMQAILDYVSANMVVTLAWSAVNSDSSPDPVTSFICTVSDPSASNIEYCHTKAIFYNMIDANLSLIEITAPSAFSISGLALSAGSTTPHSDYSENPTQLELWTDVSTQIISALKNVYLNSSFFAGTHGSYTGVGSGMQIA